MLSRGPQCILLTNVGKASLSQRMNKMTIMTTMKNRIRRKRMMMRMPLRNLIERP